MDDLERVNEIGAWSGAAARSYFASARELLIVFSIQSYVNYESFQLVTTIRLNQSTNQGTLGLAVRTSVHDRAQGIQLHGKACR